MTEEMEEVHDLIPGELKIIQNKNFFKFGTDSVLLANFIRIKSGDKVVDFGSGSGVLPLLLTYKQEPGKILGLEIQPESVDLAKRNVALNDLEDKIEIREADFCQASQMIEPDTRDLVVSNPPYLKVDGGRISNNKHLAIARHEICAQLEDVIREASRVLRVGGNLSLIHRSERLPEVLSLLNEYNLAAKRLRIVYPRRNKFSDRFLLEAKKGAKSGVEIEPPLVVYCGNSQEYTREVSHMYGAENYDT